VSVGFEVFWFFIFGGLKMKYKSIDYDGYYDVVTVDDLYERVSIDYADLYLHKYYPKHKNCASSVITQAVFQWNIDRHLDMFTQETGIVCYWVRYRYGVQLERSF
jgi:hypothetical protein